jgi:transcriptional regulator of met regulon
MTEGEWLNCADPDVMLDYLHGKTSERKLRLFACACCRRVWHLLTDERSRKVVEAAERFADGALDFDAFQRALTGANQPKSVSADLCFPEAWWAADWVALDAAMMASRASWDPAGELYKAEVEAQCRLLRDLFGNPFRPAFVHPKKLWANKGHVLNLAHTIYDDRAFDRLPILADALEEAGCTNADILNHCRQPGEHVRGCWVVDLLLGKS